MGGVIPDQGVDGVTAELNYLVPGVDPVHIYFCEPPPGVARVTARFEPRSCVIRNMRALEDRPRLDREGFELTTFETTITDPYDPDQVRSAYADEVIGLVKRRTGAREVRLFHHLLRGAEAARRRPGALTHPETNVHCDVTEVSGAQKLQEVLGAEADDFAGRRFAVVNVWRPVIGPLRDHPLALCDERTVEPGDRIPYTIFSRRVGDTSAAVGGVLLEAVQYSLRHNPRHRWCYAPDMRPDEALLIKCYDSAEDGRARLTPHGAFRDPTVAADAGPPRASIEVRTLAIF